MGEKDDSNPAEGGAPAPLERAMERLMAVPRAVVAVLILTSIAINFANVIGRYVFFSPIIWAEEAMIFIMVWCVFIGAILVTWDGRHLRMDLLATVMPSPWREIVNAVAAVAFLAITGLVVSQSWQAVVLFAELGQKSNTAEIPMVVPHAALLIGFAAMFLCVAVRFRAYVTGRLGSDVDEVAREFSAPDDARR